MEELELSESDTAGQRTCEVHDPNCEVHDGETCTDLCKLKFFILCER